LQTNRIPNIIFHGASGTGKRTIVNNFLLSIYGGDKSKLKSNVMMVNCSHGKGIKFIREELKFFAKTNIKSSKDVIFKSIVLLNADSLTIDAQSALRRCIEVFCHNTRFFIVVENKHKLLNPILSRFCEIYIPEGYLNDKFVNLHTSKIDKDYDTRNNKIESLKKSLHNFQDANNYELANIVTYSNELYEKGFAVKFIIDNIDELELKFDQSNKEILILCYHKLKPDFRCEKMLFFYILKMIYVSSNEQIKNMILI
jgi:DNA polymerase III delta prime subunit